MQKLLKFLKEIHAYQIQKNMKFIPIKKLTSLLYEHNLEFYILKLELISFLSRNTNVDDIISQQFN